MPPDQASAAVPDTWHREDLKVGEKLLIDAVLDTVDWVSIMSYHGKNVGKVLESIDHEGRYKPGKVELIQETDPQAVEEGVPLFVEELLASPGIPETSAVGRSTGPALS